MSLVTDIAGDNAIFDGVQTVTLKQNRAGTITTQTINNALYEPLTNRQINALGGVELTGKEQNWQLNNAQVGAAGVALDDVIIDASSVKWSVILAELDPITGRWDCATRKLP